jgi:hypothetical protein
MQNSFLVRKKEMQLGRFLPFLTSTNVWHSSIFQMRENMCTDLCVQSLQNYFLKMLKHLLHVYVLLYTVKCFYFYTYGM